VDGHEWSKELEDSTYINVHRRCNGPRSSQSVPIQQAGMWPGAVWNRNIFFSFVKKNSSLLHMHV
jgi:hypothetical protein